MCERLIETVLIESCCCRFLFPCRDGVLYMFRDAAGKSTYMEDNKRVNEPHFDAFLWEDVQHVFPNDRVVFHKNRFIDASITEIAEATNDFENPWKELWPVVTIVFSQLLQNELQELLSDNSTDAHWRLVKQEHKDAFRELCGAIGQMFMFQTFAYVRVFLGASQSGKSLVHNFTRQLVGEHSYAALGGDRPDFMWSKLINTDFAPYAPASVMKFVGHSDVQGVDGFIPKSQQTTFLQATSSDRMIPSLEAKQQHPFNLQWNGSMQCCANPYLDMEWKDRFSGADSEAVDARTSLVHSVSAT